MRRKHGRRKWTEFVFSQTFFKKLRSKLQNLQQNVDDNITLVIRALNYDGFVSTHYKILWSFAEYWCLAWKAYWKTTKRTVVRLLQEGLWISFANVSFLLTFKSWIKRPSTVLIPGVRCCDADSIISFLSWFHSFVVCRTANYRQREIERSLICRSKVFDEEQILRGSESRA